MAAHPNASLPEGLDVGGYRIVRRIASGGFSIVYLADDPDGRPVAIKEYLPASLARREPGALEPRVADEHLPTYRNGLRCFFEEGRALARIRHPNVVRVTNFLQAHGTVYMVMDYERGHTLQQQVLRARSRRAAPGPTIAEPVLRSVFSQVMNGLRDVHANRLLHLDLKPANIYMRADGRPLLLDFGAARRTLTHDAPTLFPMYTPGFAAPELYRPERPLGPWTDVYGLGASLFAAMAGTPPQPADERAAFDKMRGILPQLEQGYSRALVDLVDWCLRLDALERPQSVFAAQRTLRAIARAAPAG